MSDKKLLDLFEAITDSVKELGAHSVANRIAIKFILKALLDRGLVDAKDLFSEFRSAAESIKNDAQATALMADRVDRQLRTILTDLAETEDGESSKHTG